MLNRLFILVCLVAAFFGILGIGLRITDLFRRIGLNPLLGIIACVTGLLICLPLFLKGYRWLRAVLKRNMLLNPGSFFVVGLLVFLCSGCFLKIRSGNFNITIQIGESHFVARLFLLDTMAALAFLVLAAVYFYYPKIAGRNLNTLLGYFHFWISFLFLAWFLLPFLTEDWEKIPSRYIYVENKSSVYPLMDFTNPSARSYLAVLLLAQLIFLFNMLYSKFWGQVS